MKPENLLKNLASITLLPRSAQDSHQQKKIWKKEREYEMFMDTLTDEEKATLSPDEIKFKLSQIHTWREDPNDKYKNNV